MKNVLLIGIEGVYNYGCEAIVRGTVEVLKSIDKDITVSYASYNYDYDVRRLQDCDVNVIRRRHCRRWGLKSIIRKLLSFVNVCYQIPYDDVSWIDGFDTVFSIGGDIYTLDSHGGYNKVLPRFLEKCQKRGLKYVLWGASVGKFDANPKALEFFKEHLAKIDKIVLRERVSYDYLKGLGLDENVSFAPDPAFSVRTANDDVARGEGLIAVNLSPHSALYEYGDIECAIVSQCKALTSLIDAMGCNLLLVPHVISRDFRDDDLSYLKTIYNLLPDNYKAKVSLLEGDKGFLGVKRELKACSFVIAARMHCAINAICEGVPTLFLSYSEKAKGMSEFVYGSRDAVISLKDFENTQLVKERLLGADKILSVEKDYAEFDYKTVLLKK